MRNILVPTDFSENSKKALKYAFALLKNSHCNFYIHHVVTSEFDKEGLATRGVKEELMRDFLYEVQKFAFIDNHSIFSTIEDNYFIESIRNQVVKKNIDFIVMGTKGLSENIKVVVGPKTGEVIKKVKCSALVVPSNASIKTLQNVLFSTDYTTLFHAKVLSNFSKIIKLNITSVNVLHISNTNKPLNSQQNSNQLYLKDYFKNENHNFYDDVSTNYEKTIDKYITKLQIDLVAIVAKNLNIFEKILFKPTTNDFKFHSETPFLILHE